MNLFEYLLDNDHYDAILSMSGVLGHPYYCDNVMWDIVILKTIALLVLTAVLSVSPKPHILPTVHSLSVFSKVWRATRDL